METEGAQNDSAAQDNGPASVMDFLTGEAVHAPESVGKQQESLSKEKVSEILAFDPFKPKGEDSTEDVQVEGESEEKATPKKEAKKSPTKPAPKPAAAPTTPPVQGKEQEGMPAPAAPPAPDPRMAELEAMNAMLRQTVESLTKAQTQPQQAQPQAAPAPDQVEMPAAYNRIAIPDQLFAMMESEDPTVRRQAMVHLVQGTAQIIHREALLAARAEMQNIARETAGKVVDGVKTGDQIMNDYYGTYPQHANLKPLVAQASEEVMRETGLTQWSEHLKVAVGNRVNQYLQRGGFMPASAPAAPVATPGPVAPAVPEGQPVPSSNTVTRQSAPAVFAGNASPGFVSSPHSVDPNSPEGIRRSLFR